jgi:hypothetical protein
MSKDEYVIHVLDKLLLLSFLTGKPISAEKGFARTEALLLAAATIYAGSRGDIEYHPELIESLAHAAFDAMWNKLEDIRRGRTEPTTD